MTPGAHGLWYGGDYNPEQRADHLFVLNHTTSQVTVDLATDNLVNLLDPDTPADRHLQLPPYGVAVLRGTPT